MSEKLFEQMLKKDVSAHVEKKAGFSYLSWPYAVAELRKADPAATWEVRRFGDVPFMETSCGYFVEVSVTFGGVTLSQVHPVLDNANRPIGKPNAFQINTSIMRCLVKAIALHGLGLYIYAGEDLPGDFEGGEPPPKSTAPTDREAINARIVSALRAYGCKTVREAELTVKQFSAMPASDKYPAREGVTDYHKLTDGQAKVLAEKLERAAKDKASETPEVCNECRQPLSNGRCLNEPCPNAEPF